MAQHRPFRFTGLPRYSSEQLALQASITAYLSSRPYQANFAETVAASVERYLKMPCQFGVSEVRSVGRSDLPSIVPALGCLVLVGASPTERKILVDIDMGIASLAIEKLLGGSGESERIHRPLTEIEEGVLSFLVLKIMSHFQDGLNNGRELALTLDRFASRLDEVQDVIDNERNYILIGLRLAVGKIVSYARIFIPAELVNKSFVLALPQSGGSAQDYAYMRRVLQSLGSSNVTGRIEVATLDLAAADLANLEIGDIVIIENHQMQKAVEGFSGEVFVRVGAGQNGGIKARLIGGDQYRIEVQEIVVQERPQEEIMANPEHDGGDADNLPETEGLLRDVDAPVVVELGRVRMNTAQVARLRAGQVLRVPRGPNDPVDLVVNGKLFARGELIEVDGELGVRLLQVVGAG